MHDIGDPVLVDERLFSTFALLNALGFDDEFREEGMHPVRMAVREELSRRDPVLLKPVREYQDEHPDANWFSYTQYSLMLSSPPFSLLPGYEDTWAASVLRSFDEVTNAFYHDAHLADLWHRHRPVYMEEAAFMRPEVLKSVGDMWGYLRISPDQQHSRIRLVPNLMNSYFRATVFEDPVSDIVHVISGPYSKQAHIPLTVVHELLHTVIGSTIDQLEAEIEASASLMEWVADLPTVIRNGGRYPTVVEESLIRALTKRIGPQFYEYGDYSGHAAQEYSEGWVLIWHFLEQLESEYEKSEEPFLERLARMLASVDLDAERARWIETQN